MQAWKVEIEGFRLLLFLPFHTHKSKLIGQNC